MSKRFNPAKWVNRWEEVGEIEIFERRVSLFFDVDGNMVTQRSLLAQLDGKQPGRRDTVRAYLLARHDRLRRAAQAID